MKMRIMKKDYVSPAIINCSKKDKESMWFVIIAETSHTMSSLITMGNGITLERLFSSRRVQVTLYCTICTLHKKSSLPNL